MCINEEPQQKNRLGTISNRLLVAGGALNSLNREMVICFEAYYLIP